MKNGFASYAWMTMPEVQMPNAPDYKGSFPGNGGNGGAEGTSYIKTEGTNFIFLYAGNYTNWGAQFYHYYEDGMLVGQFGNNQAFPGSQNGAPFKLGYPVRPGNFGNIGHMTSTVVNGDIYVYVGDESYSVAHRWHISNLSSIHEYAGSTILQPNASVTLSRVF
jgi:hypothetical protein